jgi:hypothetical protein
MVTFGGVVHATGDIALMARTLGAKSKVVIGSLSNVQGDPTLNRGRLAGAASKVSLLSDGSIDIFGTVGRQQADSDVELLRRRQGVRRWAGGRRRSARHLQRWLVQHRCGSGSTPLLLRTNANGHLIDGQGRLIDDQGRLVNADGEFVDASGNVLASGGCARIRRRAGATRRRHARRRQSANLRAEPIAARWHVSARKVPFGQRPHRMGTCRRRRSDAKGDIRVSGRFQAMKTVDIGRPT